METISKNKYNHFSEQTLLLKKGELKDNRFPIYW